MTTKSGGDADPMFVENTSCTEVGTQAVWSLSSCKPGIYTIFTSLQFKAIKQNSIFYRIWC